MLDQLTPARSPEPGGSEPIFDLREILSFVWRHWKFAAGITAVVLAIGLTVLMRQTPLYTATAQVLLERQREKAPGVEAILAEADPDMAMVEGEMAILRSSAFLRRVVEREHLADLPTAASHPQPETGIFATIRALLPGASTPQAEPPPRSAADEKAAREIAAAEELKGSLAISRGAQFGFVLGISATSPDPARAARLANAVADAYLVDKLDTRFEAAKRASSWLNDRLTELRTQLRGSEEAVSQFRSEHGLLQSGNVTLSQQQQSELNAKLMEARADAAQKKARVDLLASLQARGSGLANMPDLGAGNNSTLSAVRQQASTLSQQEADLLAKYGPSHPLVVNIRAQQRDVERSIGAETQRLGAAIKNDYELAQSRVASLEKSLREATGQTSIDDATTIRLRELERTAAVNKTLFEDFLQRAKVTEQQSTFQPREARIITPALPPGSPSYPRKTMFVSTTLLIGLMLGAAGAVAKEMLNTGFTLPKQVEDLLGLPVLASVRRLSARDRTVAGAVVPIHEYPAVKPLARFSEAIRGLRSGIQMTDVDHPPKVLQIASAVPKEGKTTVALAMARSAALSKARVLFIDADLRHPSASRMFDLGKRPGLVELLLGQASVEDAVRFEEKVGHWILPAGGNTQTPSDLLGSARMKSLVMGLREEFDLIVIDSPPVGPVIDPIVVSQLVDKVVLVIRWGTTARELVRECVLQFTGPRKVAGVVLNVVDEGEAQKYGKYAYAYYYRSRRYHGYYTE